MKKSLLSIFIATAAALLPAAISAMGVADEPTESVTMISSQGSIEISSTIEETVRLYIFSITGQLVKTVELGPGTTRVELKSGCYVVKCDKWSKKVLVK